MFKLSKADREYREKMRGRYSPALNWYALLTHSGRERAIQAQILNDLGGPDLEEVLLPEVSDVCPPEPSRSRRRLLFSNHLFLRCVMSDEIYLSVMACKGVFKILGRAYRIPAVIEDEEMAIFKNVLNTDRAPQFASRQDIGARVRIIGGILQGLQGRLLEANAHFVKVETGFSFLDVRNAIIVSVPREQVWIDDAAAGSPAQRPAAVAHPLPGWPGSRLLRA